MSITKIHARQIFDSRGNPTIEVDLYTQKGRFRVSVPSGASTGKHEAKELRDGDKDAYGGKGVLKAVATVNGTIQEALLSSGLKVTQQKEIDDLLIKLDGTKDKTKLGANAIVGVSMAVAVAGAAEAGIPLYEHIANLAGMGNAPFVIPCPSFNVINGGQHAGNQLAFQEFMIVPVGASSFEEAMKMATETYHALKNVIKQRYGMDATNVGDEGGFAPNLTTAEEALDLLVEAISKAGYINKVKIGFDSAASEFYQGEGVYDLDYKSPDSKKPATDDPTSTAKASTGTRRRLTGTQLADLYKSLLEKYPLVFIEDPFDEDDWESWVHFKKVANVQVIADDLTVTNPERIQTAIDKKAANALLVKVNQIGTVTETITASKLAQANGWGVMVSHRSGETEGSFIADLVVGLAAGEIKSGAPARGERLAKYNQLLRIEEELKSSGKPYVYSGISGFHKGVQV
ncbi:hypothetical protein CVT26_015508 [Gymnopilus dilepis]|uniref:phosphopyruvate hydratase n=1 Tax=Gymnopilus dilepis TaxID=231916 RepID=A0A409WA33_9AGAR|nr:hypothetical protein CVT26_015508 [Gymnopilus dilepis]